MVVNRRTRHRLESDHDDSLDTYFIKEKIRFMIRKISKDAATFQGEYVEVKPLDLKSSDKNVQ